MEMMYYTIDKSTTLGKCNINKLISNKGFEYKLVESPTDAKKYLKSNNHILYRLNKIKKCDCFAYDPSSRETLSLEDLGIAMALGKMIYRNDKDNWIENSKKYKELIFIFNMKLRDFYNDQVYSMTLNDINRVFLGYMYALLYESISGDFISNLFLSNATSDYIYDIANNLDNLNDSSSLTEFNLVDNKLDECVSSIL